MLTDTHCRNAKPREKLYRLNDQRGLYLEVKPNGGDSDVGVQAHVKIKKLRKWSSQRLITGYL